MSSEYEDQDPSLDGLRAAWKQEGESVPLPPLELDDCDAATRLAVGWLQDALTLESRAHTRPVAAPPARRPIRRAGAAALALAAAAAFAMAVLRPASPSGEETAVATGPELSPPSAQSAVTSFEPERFESRPDGIELVTGNVRVVLLQPRR